mmetsp:Transcript_96921/g.278403  ORF Transcript_96921/g.278403 Transcript_96921/m.278403 type:complete len:681 (-) Transcript_96921:97-2139(-)
MSGFRDSFTKDDTKENLLGYDDTASLYFTITVLTCVALPWTFDVISSLLFPAQAKLQKRFPKKSSSGCTFHYCKTSAMTDKVDDARMRAKRWTRGSALWCFTKVVVLTSIWIGIVSTVVYLRTSGEKKEINRFDPFVILEVHAEASPIQIKRAYRKLSLVYHPDKNPDDPLAASRFIQISKAYAALTDEVAKRNWEKYGNPDGPQNTKVGIGLPRFLLEKDNTLYILVSFFLVIIVIVPMTFICYYNRTKNFAANGVLIETLQFLGFYILEASRTKAGPELLAACAESRNIPTRPTDNEQIKLLGGHVIEHKKRTFTLPVVAKNQYLIWAHMQRRHNLMSPELKSDCDTLLRHSMKVTQAMIEIACMREWFACAQAMIDFRRCLIQAIDIRSSHLLQIPHINEEYVRQCATERSKVSTLAEFLATDAEQRKRLLYGMTPDQLLDVEAFCAHVAEVDLQATLCIEDESEIVVNDVATVNVRLERKHLRPEEAMGPAHAPHFPEPKYEEWWFFLVEEEDKKRIVHFERILDTSRVLEQQLRFQVTRSGKNSLVLHAVCDSYAGLDKRVELNFEALAEEQHKRELPIHEEDMDLDGTPTLFQQWMGDLNYGDESEEEEDLDEDAKAAPKPPKSPAGRPPVGDKAERRSPSGGREEARRKDAGEGDGDSSSASDGDDSSEGDEK